jgi:hypothetical protein
MKFDRKYAAITVVADANQNFKTVTAGVIAETTY